MNAEDNIVELLASWEAQRRQGHSPCPEELCRHAPELQATVSHRIRALEATSWLEDELNDVAAAENETIHGRLRDTVCDVTKESLIDALHDNHVLEPDLLDEIERTLKSQFASAKDLTRELLDRNWLTPYQANQLLLDRGSELRLGSYVLLERIGAGGMGAVFKAQNWKLHNVVALKVIRKDRLANADTVRRFKREIQAAAKLEHANVVRTFDADEVDGKHFMVMEFVEGVDLSQKLKAEGPLRVEQARDILRQAALGLQHAFEKGLVHRDIKPGNLLLTEDGTVKILDMGLARIVHTRPDDNSTVTHDDYVMGTPDFIAPEQARSSHSADIRADIYSLGCTFYMLLTGTAPFPGDTLMDKLLSHQKYMPPPVDTIVQDVPSALSAALAKMMARRPEDRFLTPAEIVEVLDGKKQIKKPSRPTGTLFDFSGEAAPVVREKVDVKTTEPSASISRSRLAVLGGVVLAGVVGMVVLVRSVFMDVETPHETAPDAPFNFSKKKESVVPEVIAARRIAEWALTGNPKSYITVATADKTFRVDDVQKLPKSDFRIVAVTGQYANQCHVAPLKYLQSLGDTITMSLTYVPITDEHLRYFSQADRISYLLLYGTEVTNDGLKHLSKLKKLTNLSLRTGTLTGACLVHVKDMVQLTSFGLAYSDTRDEDIAHLSELTNLTDLGLYHTKITDRALVHLKPLTRLQKLSLAGNPAITDDGLALLSHMTSLETLTLIGCNVSGTGLKNLSIDKTLTNLSLGVTVFAKDYGLVSNAGMEQIARFKNLDVLGISGKSVTNDGLRYLSELTQLRFLSLASPTITDAGLKHLHSLTNLERLTLTGSGITEPGVAALRKALPKCKEINVKAEP